MTGHRAFWQCKSLSEMTDDEWESLCDGCGNCCRVKLEDADSGEILETSAVCRLLELDTCRCSDYPNRFERVPGCAALSPKKVESLPWLPSTCAYRRLAEGRDLPAWHYLVCGDRDEVHRQGISVRGRVVSEDSVDDVVESVLSGDLKVFLRQARRAGLSK